MNKVIRLHLLRCTPVFSFLCILGLVLSIVGAETLSFFLQQHVKIYARTSDIAGAPTLTATTIDTIFARVGSPMVGTGTVVEQAARVSHIDDAFALAVWWTETNDGKAGVGLTDRNPGSVKGNNAGLPLAYDNYTIYPSYAAAITDWFSLVRNNYVNCGYTNIYTISTRYVGSSSAPDWAIKVASLTAQYHRELPAIAHTTRLAPAPARVPQPARLLTESTPYASGHPQARIFKRPQIKIQLPVAAISNTTAPHQPVMPSDNQRSNQTHNTASTAAIGHSANLVALQGPIVAILLSLALLILLTTEIRRRHPAKQAHYNTSQSTEPLRLQQRTHHIQPRIIPATPTLTPFCVNSVPLTPTLVHNGHIPPTPMLTGINHVPLTPFMDTVYNSYPGAGNTDGIMMPESLRNIHLARNTEAIAPISRTQRNKQAATLSDMAEATIAAARVPAGQGITAGGLLSRYGDNSQGNRTKNS